MTTLVRTRTPLEPLSMNQQPQRRRSKRLAAYEEEDGDFKFTRGSKRAKTQPTAPEPSATVAPARSKQKAQENEAQTEKKKPTRRKMSFSTPKQDAEPAASKPKGGPRRRSKRNSQETQPAQAQTYPVEQDEQDNIALVGASSDDVAADTAVEISTESTRIALPFSDTPIINRNKELRRKTGGRRSSLGLRGRRASSLIDNGHSATPHEQVETSQFFKHIEAEGLSEPRRMKQLLTWCGERALGARPSHNNPDSAAILAARHIKESLLKDFSNRSEMSDWFNREDSGRSVVVKRANPLNIQNAAKIQELEERIKKLKAEKSQWKSLLSNPPTLSPLVDEPNMPAPPPSAIDADLLDPEEQSILAALQSTAASSSSSLISSTADRTKLLLSRLEFQVDQFADGIHKLEQARQSMDEVATKVLALSAVRLEEREKTETEAVGTRDLPIQEVLRSLSRIMPEGRTGR